MSREIVLAVEEAIRQENIEYSHFHDKVEDVAVSAEVRRQTKKEDCDGFAAEAVYVSNGLFRFLAGKGTYADGTPVGAHAMAYYYDNNTKMLYMVSDNTMAVSKVEKNKVNSELARHMKTFINPSATFNLEMFHNDRIHEQMRLGNRVNLANVYSTGQALQGQQGQQCTAYLGSGVTAKGITQGNGSCTALIGIENSCFVPSINKNGFVAETKEGLRCRVKVR